LEASYGQAGADMSLNIDATTLAADASDEAKQLRKHILKAAKTALTEEGSNQEPISIDFHLGNHHQTAIPDQLLDCETIDSDQKIIWCQMWKGAHHSGQPTVRAKQAKLAKILGSSQATVTIKLTGLRIHRWVTRCAVIKSEATGLYQVSVNAVHVRPLSIQDTLYLDPGYIQWLESLTQRKSVNYKPIRESARKMLLQLDDEIAHPSESGSMISADHGASSGVFGGNEPKPIQNMKVDESVKLNRIQNMKVDESVKLNRIQNMKVDESVELNRIQNMKVGESGEKSSYGATIGNNIKTLLRSSSSFLNKTTTTPTVDKSKNAHKKKIEIPPNSSAAEATTVIEFSQATQSPLRFPKCLAQPERNQAAHVLRNASDEDKQFLLDFLRDRVADLALPPVGNKLGFLSKITKMHLAGELEPSSYGLKREPVVTPGLTGSPKSQEQEQAEYEKHMVHLLGEERAKKHLSKFELDDGDALAKGHGKSK